MDKRTRPPPPHATAAARQWGNNQTWSIYHLACPLVADHASRQLQRGHAGGKRVYIVITLSCVLGGGEVRGTFGWCGHANCDWVEGELCIIILGDVGCKSSLFN